MNIVDAKLEEYCVNISSKPSALCEELANYTKANVDQSQMLIGPMEAAVLGFLIRAARYKRILEIGTFTGYSALAMAENLPADGELISLDINPETTKIAQSFWARSPHGSKIKHRLGKALESLKEIPGQFDFVFIDADKEPYLDYFKIGLERLSAGGSIVIDNTLWSGEVLKPNATGSTAAIQRLNEYVQSLSEKEFFSCLLPVRDGMLLVQRRR